MGCGWTINQQPFSSSPGRGTNNEAEYHALINLLAALVERVQPEDSVEIGGDSELVISQVHGDYSVRSAKLYPLWKQADGCLDKLRRKCSRVSLRWHAREENQLADAASKRAIGVDPEREKASRAPSPGYGKLTEAAKLAGSSAVIAGRVLDNLGYREGAKPTQKAWEERLVSEHFPNPRLPYSTKDWHIERVAELVRRATPEQRGAGLAAVKPKVQLIALRGNTYPHREAIKAAGGRWDKARKVWRVPESEHGRLAQLIEGREAGEIETGQGPGPGTGSAA